MYNLTGKKVLVTGATGDIGCAISRKFHAAGAVVGLSGRRYDMLEALEHELGDRSRVLQADLSKPVAVEALIGDASSSLGGLDILVNNAGMTSDNLTVRIKDDEWEDVLDVNLSVPFRLIRAALRLMMKRRWGRIINITSIVGFTGNPGQANYAAAKAGMVGMTKSIAQEVASRGITVNCVAPGFIESAMTNSLPKDIRDRLTAEIPVRRMGQGGDIASSVAFLASEEASYITGQTLHVNGGMAMY